ncbi:MAG: zinc transporter ZupT [Firmicutes bacterium]|nr:zinc transporter ZupT [Bacillota bacterium]
MSSNTILLAFGLTLIAGLATGIGSLLALFTRSTNKKFLSVSLGFSAGVMLYVSFMEILPEAQNSLSLALGNGSAAWLAFGSFIAGIFVIALIDHFVPDEENPHEVKKVEDLHRKKPQSREVMRTGLLTALAIAIHNFPEGLATFVSAIQDPSLGIAITVAVAIHNIPEGIAVSAPVFFATGDRKKAFWLSFLSGLAEPLGAVVGYLFLMRFINDLVLGVLFAMVAGIMVYIALDELLPTAREYEDEHISIYGTIAGMIVMGVSLLLLR